METIGVFRTECCQQLINALADDPRATLRVVFKPSSSRDRGARRIYLRVDLDGYLLASCTHRVPVFELERWAMWVHGLMRLHD